jgi:hypothetical protein
MSDVVALQELLKTVASLAVGGAIKRPAGAVGHTAGLMDTLVARWTTKQRLIERVLGNGADVRATLDQFEARTREFIERNPGKIAWRDKVGQEWRADLVLQACAELRDHLDSWNASDADFDGDDGGADDDPD